MAAERPKWQLCKFCGQIRERPCIEESETRSCETLRRVQAQQAERSAGDFERNYRDFENW